MDHVRALSDQPPFAASRHPQLNLLHSPRYLHYFKLEAASHFPEKYRARPCIGSAVLLASISRAKIEGTRRQEISVEEG
jgi:hypothetical protein